MFTGLIDHCGVIKVLQQQDETFVLQIETQFDDLLIGESIAVDGACLTATEFDGHTFRCEVSPETKKLTIIEDYQPGTKVNLERALRLQDRVGGHFVTGHIDQTARIKTKHLIKDFVELFIDLSEKDVDAYQSFLIKKGSIAVNGVSLTINDVFKQGIQLMLIPHTLMKTNLSHLSAGDHVNIEFDCLAKMVARQVGSVDH